MLMPALARSLKSADTVDRILAQSSLLLLGAAVPIAILTTVLAHDIVSLLFGLEYLASVAPLSLLIWSVVTVFANAPFAYLMLARLEDSRYLIATGSGALINIVANLALIPSLGMIGAALATLMAELLVLVMVLWFTRSKSIRLLGLAISRLFVPAVGLSLVAVAFRHSALMAVGGGLLTYVILLAAQSRIGKRIGGTP